MKPCVQCRNELPDTAQHCVYCGSRQPPSGPPQGARTVMGYPGMANDLARQAPPGVGMPPQAPGPDGRGGRVSTPPPGPGKVGAFDQTQPISNGHFAAGGYGGGPHAGMAGPPMGGPPQGYGGPPMGGPPQGYGGPPMGGPPPGYGGPPMGGPPPGYGGPPMGGPPPGYGGPPMGGPPPGYGGPPPGPYGGPPPGMGGPGPYGGPPPGYGPGYGQPAPYGDNRQGTEPVRHMQRAYGGGVAAEPWVETLRTIMLVFGVLLVACFVAPWKVIPGQTVFSWTILGSEVPASAKILPILLAATGILSVFLGALPLATLPRGFAAALIGFGPMLYGAVAPPFQWQELLGVVGAVTLVAGLLVRSHYTDAGIGRVMATIGAICVLVPQVVPVQEQVPLVNAFKALGTNATVPALLVLVPVFLAVISLIVWLPGPGRAGTHILAWIWIVLPLLLSLTAWLSGGEVGAVLKSNLDGILYVPMAAMAWGALVGYGVATVVGKQLET